MAELTEITPMLALHWLNSRTFDEYLIDCADEQKRRKFTKKDMNNRYNKLGSFVGTRLLAGGVMKCIYHHSLNMPSSKGGRLFCGTSIQGLPREYRDLLLRDSCTDVDMKCCHCVILLYLCRKYNIEHIHLEYYVNNRDSVLALCPDREYGKKIFLENTNNNKYKVPELGTPEFHRLIRLYSNENKRIQKAICNLPQYKDIIDCVGDDKAWNKNGSGLNKVMCYYENIILGHAEHVVRARGIEICTYMFDGMIVYGNHYNDPTLLREIEQYVETKIVGLNMQWDYKPFSDKIHIPEDYIVHEPEWTDSCSHLEEFEKNHLKIVCKGIFIKHTDTENILYSKKSIKDAYEHLCWEEYGKNGDKKTINLINTWLVNNNKIRSKMDMGSFPHPLVCPDTYFNMWIPFAGERSIEGFVYNPDDSGLLFILNHIKILCNNDDIIYDYFVKWIAQMIQYPAIKTIIPTLISKEGAGKGTLLKLLGLMLGEKKIMETTDPSRDVWGGFNPLMVDSFLVNLNEMSKKDTIDSMGRIKGLITDSTITINLKGVNAYSFQSYHRFLITTNGEDPIESKTDDRRNFIVRSSDEKCGDKKYFVTINQYMDDPVVVKQCYEYFKQIPDMDSFGLIQKPVTVYQQNIQQAARSMVDLWAEAFTYKNQRNDKMMISNADLYTDIMAWISSEGLEFKMSNVSFGKRLGNSGIVGFMKNGLHGWDIDINLLKKHYKV